MNNYLQKKVVWPLCLFLCFFGLAGIPKAMAQYTVTFQICGVPDGTTSLNLFSGNAEPGTNNFPPGSQDPLTGDWSVSVTFPDGVVFPNWSLGTNVEGEAVAFIANFCPCTEMNCGEVPGLNGNCTTFMNRNPELNGEDGAVYKVNWGDPVVELAPTLGPGIACPINIAVATVASATPDITGMATADDPAAVINFTEIVTSATCSSGPIINRVWAAVNACGESSTCTQTITTSGPTESTFEVSYEILNVPPTALEVWGGLAMFAGGGTPAFNFTTANAQGNFIHDREYPCGADLFQNFIFGNEGPVLEANFCPLPLPGGINGNCLGAAGFMAHNPGMEGNFDAAYTITYGGNDFTIIPPPTLAGVPASVVVSCSDPIPGDPGGVTAVGGCNSGAGAIVTFSQSALLEGPPNSGVGIIINTWTAEDACGITSSETQIVSIVDMDGPVIDCAPMAVTVEVGGDTSPAAIGMATATDCDPTFTLVSADATDATGLCGGESVITRTWTGTDACGNTSTCVQIITLEDTTPPMITSCPADLGPIEGCDQTDITTATAGFPYSPTAANVPFADFTGTIDGTLTANAIATYVDVITDDSCPNPILSVTRTWSVTDACGNTSNTCQQIITLQDMTVPVITCPANVTIECDEDTSPANTGTAIGLDNCSAPNDVAITFSDMSTQGTAGCDQYEYTITRTWTATDLCGNTSTCQQTINVEDSTAPMITCPADITIECDEDTSPANTGMAMATDNCSAEAEIVITSSDESTQGMVGCPKYEYTITRTWTATDACGNTSTCVQTIEVEDSTPPVITCPANIFGLDCLSGPLPTANTIAEFIDIGGTGMDNCSTADEWMISFSDSPAGRDLLDYCSSNPADRTLTRTYSISDACGNVSTCAQTFTFNQSLNGPIITTIPLDQVVSCGVEAFPQMAAFNAETDCALGSTKTVEALPVIGTENCPGARYQFRYTVEDVCGRTATHIQTYTIQNDPFEYICPTIDCEIDCGATAEEAIAAFDLYTQHAIFVTSCPGLDPTVYYSFNPNSLGGCGSQTTVNFTATDPCGRSASCASTIVVVDNTAPVITGQIPDAFRNCGAFANSDYQSWAQGALQSVEIENNCDNTITWSYSPSSPNAENCSNGLISTTEVTFTATDNCGNASQTTAKFYLKVAPVGGNSMTVSGDLRTESNEPVELVELSVSGSGLEETANVMVDGYYEFSLVTDNNYVVTPSRNDHPLNGISTMDLILISRHVLGVETLDSPYRLIAADVNNNGEITAFDMVELRKLLLMINTEFENNTSWRFVAADHVFADPTNPFESTFPISHSINNLVENVVADFIGIKTGDVNGSAIANQLAAQGDSREGLDNLVFQVDDQQLRAGETYTVDFKAKDFASVLGYQFTLDFDQDQLDFVDFTTGQLSNLSSDNFGTHLREGVITSSWNVQKGVDLQDNEVLFSLSFKAKADVELSQVISLNSKFTTSEAYTQDESLMNLELAFNQGNDLTEAAPFKLYQNQPNPFKDQTIIGFRLPESSKATLTVYDVSGRVISQRVGDYSKGYNEVTINRSELANAGVLYYRLETLTDHSIKKMIIID